VKWIIPSSTAWTFDLDELRAFIPELEQFHWLRGKVSVEPEFLTKPKHVAFAKDMRWTPESETTVAFYILPSSVKGASVNLELPTAIRDSLARFKGDYPDSASAAFIMMRFGSTRLHSALAEAVKDVCSSHGIKALRADEKDYHDDLFPNVLTYIYGCRFGIAVFERLEQNDFNPNVSLEVGYMLALGKPVCLLKDKTLTTLQTDLVGRLYKSFDPQDPSGSIPKELTQWLRDRAFIA